MAPIGESDLVEAANRVVGSAGIATQGMLNEDDAYYIGDRRSAPLPVYQVIANDANSTRYYIDPKTAQVVGSYRSGAQSWVNRWLYHGLHSINFPWLYNYRPAWDIVVLTLMLGGTSLCVTSVIIGFQLVRRKLFIRRATGASL